MDPLRFVKFFASTKHGNQQYSMGQPYAIHLAAVEGVIKRFSIDIQNTITKQEMAITLDDLYHASWLHDVVEDTGTKLKEVEEMFGSTVARLVGAVTNEPGDNRKIRAALTYPKILATPGAVALKLADRIANVEMGGSLVQMYAKEHEGFRRNLYTPGEFEQMWAHLDYLLEYKATNKEAS